MAKLNGLIGSGSGKVGVMVFSKGKGGQTIVRSYQSQVSNPNTIPQQLQRVKMNLAGKISSVVPSSALVALGMGNHRDNRADFSRTIIRNATSGLIEGVPQAQVNPERLVWGRGSAPMLASLGAATFTTNSISVAVTVTPGTYAGAYGVRVIALVARAATTPTDYQFAAFTDHVFNTPTVGETQVTESVTIVTPNMANGNQVMLYVVPFVLSERGLTAFGNDFSYSDAQLSASLSMNSGYVNEWGSSFYGGVVPFA